jgi:ribosomal protein S18 acetylase RimI-like enzyme
MRIGTEHTKLMLKQRGSLYLGAFTVDDAGVEIGQVGMMKLRPETVRHKGGPQRIVWIDEMDVLPTLTRLGIGRAMAHSALVGYATELNCSDIRLHVVQSNEQARRFYERQLSLQVTGETSLGEGMPDSMLRDEMGGTVAGALATLNNNNRWLAGAT